MVILTATKYNCYNGSLIYNAEDHELTNIMKHTIEHQLKCNTLNEAHVRKQYENVMNLIWGGSSRRATQQ
jgi:DNA-directed RNA polymerase subunit F